MNDIIDAAPFTVAYVSPGWPPEAHPNGIVSYLVNLAAGLDECDADHRIIAGEFAGAETQRALRARPVLESCSGWKRLLLKAARRLAPDRMRHYLRAESLLPVIEQLHRESGLRLVEMEESFGCAAMVMRKSPVSVVVRLHGPWFLVGSALGVPHSTAYRRRVRAEGEAIARAAGVSAPSRHVLECVRGYYGLELANARVIPNPIAPVPLERQWSPATCEPDTLLFVGRFDRVKGADILLDAFAQVRRVRPEVRLTAIGPVDGMLDGAGQPISMERFLGERLPDESARAAVRWLPALSPDEILSLRRQHAVTVVCSRFENCPMTLLEAMACGCPVVASEVGGIPELIRYGENGLLFRSEDADDLAHKILLLLSQPELAARLGRNASETAGRRHHPAAIARQTLAFYGEVLGQPVRETTPALAMAATA